MKSNLLLAFVGLSLLQCSDPEFANTDGGDGNSGDGSNQTDNCVTTAKWNCQALGDCGASCGANSDCVDSCRNEGCPEAQTLFDANRQCIMDNCISACIGGYNDSCVNCAKQNCQSQIDACKAQQCSSSVNCDNPDGGSDDDGGSNTTYGCNNIINCVQGCMVGGCSTTGCRDKGCPKGQEQFDKVMLCAGNPACIWECITDFSNSCLSCIMRECTSDWDTCKKNAC